MGTHKQFFSAKCRQPLFYSVLLIICMAIVDGCKKLDTPGSNQPPTELATKFLTLPASTTPEVRRIAVLLKQKNERTGFLNEMAQKDGFAVWDKVIVNTSHTSSNRMAARTSSTGDTIIYIPLVPQNANYVSAFIYARLNGSIHLQLHRANNYEAYGFGNIQDSTDNAERLALQVMMLDNAVFGHTKFTLLDNRLFHHATVINSHTTRSERYLQLKDADSAATGTNQRSASAGHWETGTVTHCTYGMQYHCTGGANGCQWDGSCDACPQCQHEDWNCVTTVQYYFVSDDDDWNTNYGNGGGSGGGAAPTGPVPCNPTPLLDDGLIPCPQGNTTGFLPMPSTELEEVDDNDITDPCLKAVVTNISKTGLANFISRSYDEQSYTPNTTDRYKVKYEIDTTLVNSSGSPVPGRTNMTTNPDGTHQVNIKLNTKLFQNSTREWVSAVVLHEMMHGILAVRSPLDSTDNLVHKGMFAGLAPITIAQSLKELFPTLDNHDAMALGMDGLGLPGIFMIPDPNNPGSQIINPFANTHSITNYSQSIAQAVSAVVPYRIRAGNTGTPYC